MFVAVSFSGSFVGFLAWSAFHFADRHFSPPLYSGLRPVTLRCLRSIASVAHIDAAEEGYACLDHSIVCKKKDYRWLCNELPW